jgi:hypothetical protein
MLLSAASAGAYCACRTAAFSATMVDGMIELNFPNSGLIGEITTTLARRTYILDEDCLEERAEQDPCLQ